MGKNLAVNLISPVGVDSPGVLEIVTSIRLVFACLGVFGAVMCGTDSAARDLIGGKTRRRISRLPYIVH